MNFSIKYEASVGLLVCYIYRLTDELQSHIVNEKHFVVMFVSVYIYLYSEENMGFWMRKCLSRANSVTFIICQSFFSSLLFFLGILWFNKAP